MRRYSGYLPGVGLDEVGNVAPGLGPHVAEQVGGHGPGGRHHAVPVEAVQLVPDIRVQLRE